MKRESSFEKRFQEIKEFDCQNNKDGLCENRSCDCAVDLRRNIIERFVEDYRKTNPICYWLTLLHPHGICDAGRLGEVKLSEIKSLNLRLLRKAGVNNLRVIGHTDIVLQDYNDGGSRKSRWHVHIHLLLWANETEASIKKKIYGVYNRDGNKRVAKLEIVTAPAPLYAYMLKYIREHKKKLISSAGWQCRPVYEIRGRFRAELISFYSNCSIDDAFILIGFRRYGVNIRPWPQIVVDMQGIRSIYKDSEDFFIAIRGSSGP